jgi:hypothetical protein
MFSDLCRAQSDSGTLQFGGTGVWRYPNDAGFVEKESRDALPVSA